MAARRFVLAFSVLAPQLLLVPLAAAADETPPDQRFPASVSGDAPSANVSGPTPDEPEPAESQSAAAPSVREPASIEPPSLLSGEVTYPAGLHGNGRVVLELVIDADGAVESAQVTGGDFAFADAAKQAAAAFHFSPARRDGRPVRARILFEVTYREPSLAPPADGSFEDAGPERTAPEGPAKPTAQTAKVTEVVILGRSTPGALVLGQAEARQLPGAFGDPLRALSVLPGVAPVVTGLPLFFVRGAPPGNVGFFVDGVRIPLLYHAFLGPSVLHPATIDRVTLFPTAYPAQLGRFAGGIVSVDLVEPTQVTRGEWSVRLIDAGAFIQSPVFGGRGQIMVGGRYSYTALVLSLLSDLKLSYWDYEARLSYDLTRRDTLSVFAFGAYDYFDPNPGAPAGESPDVVEGESGLKFHRLDFRYERRIGSASSLRAALTLGTDRSQGSQGYVTDRVLGGRVDLRAQLSDAVQLNAGFDGWHDAYSLRIETDTENFQDVTELFPTRSDGTQGVYAELPVLAGGGIRVTPAVRLDRFVSRGERAWGINPSLSAKVPISDSVSILHALGIAHQPPNFVPAVPGVAVAGLPGGLQRGVQTSAGVEAEFSHSGLIRATVFHSGFFNLTDPISLSQSLELDAERAARRSMGSALGFELFAKGRLTTNFRGMLSYTLSRSRLSYETIQTRAGYDRPHILSLTGSYALPWATTLSARGVAYSGVPGNRITRQGRIFDQERAAPFARLDVRLEKFLALSGGSSLSVVAEAMNATLSREVLRRPCSEEGCDEVVVGPLFLPSLGVEGRF